MARRYFNECYTTKGRDRMGYVFLFFFILNVSYNLSIINGRHMIIFYAAPIKLIYYLQLIKIRNTAYIAYYNLNI